MLSTVEALQTMPEWADEDPAALSAALKAADAAVKRYCKRDLELQVYTEYQNGSGIDSLALRQRPVVTVDLTGTLSNGSAVITGLADTTGLLVGMPVVAGVGETSPEVIPNGAVIESIDSDANTVTLSDAVTGSGSMALVFGLCVWLDVGGYFGRGVGSFGITTRMTEGKDFVLRRDSEGGLQSKSAVLVRLGGGITAGPLDWPFFERGRGTLTARVNPYWPRAIGNIKLCYAAGYNTTVAGWNVPEDLSEAVNQVAVWIRKFSPTGGLQVQGESYQGYQYSLLSQSEELATTRQLLSHYREMVC